MRIAVRGNNFDQSDKSNELFDVHILVGIWSISTFTSSYELS